MKFMQIWGAKISKYNFKLVNRFFKNENAQRRKTI